jgi:hypothetical protein
MSTVAEIEMAIEHLPAEDWLRLRQWLLSRPVPSAGRPKTGAELAATHARRFHLSPSEAEAFASELSAAKIASSKVPAWE